MLALTKVSKRFYNKLVIHSQQFLENPTPSVPSLTWTKLPLTSNFPLERLASDAMLNATIKASFTKKHLQQLIWSNDGAAEMVITHEALAELFSNQPDVLKDLIGKDAKCLYDYDKLSVMTPKELYEHLKITANMDNDALKYVLSGKSIDYLREFFGLGHEALLNASATALEHLVGAYDTDDVGFIRYATTSQPYVFQGEEHSMLYCAAAKYRRTMVSMLLKHHALLLPHETTDVLHYGGDTHYVHQYLAYERLARHYQDLI